MPNKLQMNGLTEFRAALRELPETLRAQAEEIVDNRAELAQSEIVQRYPRRTGNLRKGVVIRTIARGRRVLNRAPHAHLYDRKDPTKPRRTKRGLNRGVMPATKGGPVFVPTVVKHRRLLEDELIDLLTREGLTVERT